LSAQSPISISRATLGHDLIYFDLIQVTKPSTFPELTALSALIWNKVRRKPCSGFRASIKRLNSAGLPLSTVYENPRERVLRKNSRIPSAMHVSLAGQLPDQPTRARRSFYVTKNQARV
jgi:hypothetical protein